MVRQAREGTRPERVVRSLLHRMGARFRVARRDLPGRPDASNARRKWAVFVHGCFWHQHPGCPRATVPRRNAGFWLDKFAANAKRDAKVTEELREGGYQVVIVWECETEDETALRKRLCAEVPCCSERRDR